MGRPQSTEQDGASARRRVGVSVNTKGIAALLAITAAGCSSQSAILTNDSGQAVKCENWGFGIIGAPVAMASQSDCVKKANEAGYHQGSSSAAAAVAPKPSAAAGSLGLAFPEGWQTRPLTDAQRKAGVVVLYATNTTTDSQVLLIASNLQGITDRNAYILSRRASEESHLKDATHSDVADISVNGRPAKQFQVTGTNGQGARMTFVATYIFGETKVVGVTAVTTAPNFDNQRAALQGLAERVSGIQ